MIAIFSIILLVYFIPGVLLAVAPNSWTSLIIPLVVLIFTVYNDFYGWFLGGVDQYGTLFHKLLFLVGLCFLFPLVLKCLAIILKYKGKIKTARVVSWSGLLGSLLAILFTKTIS